MRRNYTKLAALTAIMAMMGSPMGGSGMIPSSSNVRAHAKDQIKDEQHRIRTQSRKETFGSGIGHRILLQPSFTGNQRQYRKKCRSNPWIYNSTKHRSKN